MAGHGLSRLQNSTESLEAVSITLTGRAVSGRKPLVRRMQIRLSIVVPVYRSEKTLTALVEEIAKSTDALGLSDQFEMLLVNDGSPDNSWQVISRLAKEYGFLKGISLRKNFGQHSAIMAGLHYCHGEMVIIMDDDLQHPPEEIGKLLSAIDAGFDVCYVRYQGRQHASWKILGSRFNDWVATWLLGKPKGLYLSSFKAMRGEVAQEVIKYDGPYAYLDGLILDVTRSIAVVDIHHRARREGKGNYNLTRSISLWLRMATNFSVFPLRFATVLGFGLSIVSFIVITAVLVQRLRHPDWPVGWASLLAAVLFVGGVQTFCIGVVGEYIGRAYLRINGKPQFVVGAVTPNAARRQ
jgi:polyisoprenyl-phosphate glycosyltransferase